MTTPTLTPEQLEALANPETAFQTALEIIAPPLPPAPAPASQTPAPGTPAAAIAEAQAARQARQDHAALIELAKEKLLAEDNPMWPQSVLDAVGSEMAPTENDLLAAAGFIEAPPVTDGFGDLSPAESKILNDRLLDDIRGDEEFQKRGSRQAEIESSRGGWEAFVEGLDDAGLSHLPRRRDES